MDFYNGDYSGLIEFSSAIAENPFGATLLELAENQYDDIDTAVLDIAETLQGQGFDADEEIVLGLMTGEILPDEEVVELLSELGTVVNADDEIDEAATERNKAKLFEGAIAAYEIAEALLEDEGEDEEEVEDEEDEEVEAEYEEEDEDDASFSRYFQAQEEMQNRMAYTDALSELRDYGEELRSKKCLTPHAFNLLFSRRAKDDYMNFSQTVESTDYTPEEYLMCMKFALNMFEEMGPLPGTAYQFSSVVEQEVNESPYNFSDSNVEEEARDLLKLLHDV